MFTKYEFSLSDLDRATLVLSLEREAHWCREFIKEFSEDPVVIEDPPVTVRKVRVNVLFLRNACSG